MDRYRIKSISVPSPTKVTRDLRAWFTQHKMSQANAEGYSLSQINELVRLGNIQSIRSASQLSRRTTPVRLQVELLPPPATGNIAITFIRGLRPEDVLDEKDSEVGRVTFEWISQ